MDDKFQILRGSAVSDNAQDNDKSLRIGVCTTTGVLHDSDYKAVVDLNRQFMTERDACTDYRVILTLNPFCTNVLFNACTEIVRNEGSDNVEVVNGESRARLTQVDKQMVSGLTTNLSAYEMVRDTEYSKGSIGYEYHPGMDIFNNHILRNKTYRIVNRLRAISPTSNTRMVFNTIEDTMRASDGSDLKKCCRLELNDTVFRKKHLYDYDDILTYHDRSAINDNLKDQDGWLGFANTSVIPSKYANGDEMDISRALNNRENCEFVDMYPDRTLFSVVPKYNKYRNRLEYNWDYTLTYPYESTTTYQIETHGGGSVVKQFQIVADGTCNAIPTIDVQYVMLPNTKNGLMFRSPVKHNLSVGDKVVLYFNKEDSAGAWEEIPHPVTVNGVGDLDNNNQDYYFYTTDTTIFEYIFIPESQSNSKWDYVKSYFYKQLDLSSVPESDPNRTYHPGNLVSSGGTVYMCRSESVGFSQSNFVAFSDVVIPEYSNEHGISDIPTEYDAYIQVGSAKYELYNHDMSIPYHESSYDANRFIRQIINNAFSDNDNPIDGSAPEPTNPLWRDYIQFRFAKTDGNLKSEYYIRKFRKIPNIKYGTDSGEPLVDCGFDSEYYRLAFANTVYGDEIAQSVVMDDVSIEGLKDNLGRPLTEIYLTVVKANRGWREWYYDENGGPGSENVEFSHCFGPVTCGLDILGMCTDNKAVKDKRISLTDARMICNEYIGTEKTMGDREDIKVSDEWFYGDVAEFCPWTCEETVLSDVCFRFNTAQREYIDNDVKFPFYFDEITSDDYDYQGFNVEKYQVRRGNYKKEGYYYKPHHRIALKGFGNVNQASHRALDVTNAEPIQMDGIYIKIRTSLRHKLYGGERVRIMFKENHDQEWWLSVVSVPDKYTFIMERIHHGNGEYMNWMEICDALNNGYMVVEAENRNIPAYATRTGRNTYLWRNVTNPWDLDNTTDGIEEFPFANGRLYVDEVFGLFVRRQDPYGCNRLCDNRPKTAEGGGKTIDTECTSDIVGRIPSEPEALYKDDSFAIC